jgi:alkylation response protein AidB-like acyl-CoA dehydrogenase
MDAKPWQMAGMQATRSGRYDFTGVSITSDDWLGEPDAYYREPHFEGGIWRYCAAHLGAAEALFAHYRDGLVRSSRAEDPHQQRRIAECAIALESTRLWLVRAAQAVEADGASSNTATLSLLAREATADNCRLVIERVEAGLGMAAFAQGTPIERIARDLRVFLCQANPDGKRVKAAAALIDGKFLPADL